MSSSDGRVFSFCASLAAVSNFFFRSDMVSLVPRIWEREAYLRRSGAEPVHEVLEAAQVRLGRQRTITQRSINVADLSQLAREIRARFRSTIEIRHRSFGRPRFESPLAQAAGHLEVEARGPV